ncbi:hypothetical protein LF41_662 [Lysobacter dokdonensis DS-58]|uniref:Uncharacterized protein n=1 Tax=Lysobacter dokdonensis DS-58 TaxID=1300345 RepID=A0A0A2WIU4_9GAMM|nr:hypothetical protein LF41_662 [Lysobacter dokdonensis DS-58]
MGCVFRTEQSPTPACPYACLWRTNGYSPARARGAWANNSLTP